MTGFKIAVLSDGFQDCGVVGDDGSGISLRLSCACKRQVHQKMPSEGSDGIGIGESEAVAHAQ
ncbi:hypothetical protein [Neisseria polysaccharea]|uniref:hypothetical protein n=1 Tax=Neisseria polysaccharea TaxID=489 RepID=UPI00030D4017